MPATSRAQVTGTDGIGERPDLASHRTARKGAAYRRHYGSQIRPSANLDPAEQPVRPHRRSRRTAHPRTFRSVQSEEARPAPGPACGATSRSDRPVTAARSVPPPAREEASCSESERRSLRTAQRGCPWARSAHSSFAGRMQKRWSWLSLLSTSSTEVALDRDCSIHEFPALSLGLARLTDAYAARNRGWLPGVIAIARG